MASATGLSEDDQNMKGHDDIGLAEFERKREEKIDGIIYDMSPRLHFLHGVINSNIHRVISAGLKDSMCLVYIEKVLVKKCVVNAFMN